jgi:sugar phosphate isomerase/epimerase
MRYGHQMDVHITELFLKGRIGHCHRKDATKTTRGFEWAVMGKGIIDWVGPFKALKRDGYHHTVSLETHWRGAGRPEASSLQSWAGMKVLWRRLDTLGRRCNIVAPSC